MKRKLSEIANTDALEYALYSVEQRAIPHAIDGFKPVQRFVMYSALKNARATMKKIASIASVVSDLGYHHGEVSAQDAACLMASDWCNNFPYLEGEGSFGSRMIQEPAQARYVFARVHQNFLRFHPDLDIEIPHKDPEHIPPMFYVPIIPTVLLNGIRGIGTGYSCTILPYDIKWVTAATKQAVETGSARIKGKKPVVKFPEYHGNVIVDPENPKRHIQEGTYNVSGYTVEVTEIPTTYEHPDYIALLDKRKDEGKIISYQDKTAERFNFVVKLKRGTLTGDKDKDHEIIMNLLGLRVSKPFNSNINVIGVDGKLKIFNEPEDLIEYFVKYRMDFLKLRISTRIELSQRDYDLAIAKVKFINQVVNGVIDLRKLKKAELISYIESHITPKYATILASMSLDKFTTDEAEKQKQESIRAEKELDKWMNTTPKDEYLSDLKGL